MPGRPMNAEIKIGLFAMVVILVLSYMTFKSGGLRISRDEGYTLQVLLDDSAGIDLNTKVKVAGVDAGHVSAIGLEKGKARITLSMDPGVTIHRDAEISVRSLGFLGDKYLSLSAGSPDAPLLPPGGRVENFRETIAFDHLATRMTVAADSLSRLADSLNDTLGSGELREHLLATMRNIRDVSGELKAVLDRQDTKLHQVLTEIEDLVQTFRTVLEENREPLGKTTANLAEFSELLRQRAPALADQLQETAETLRNTVRETRDPILGSVDNLNSATESLKETAASFKGIAEKIDQGQGSLGKLVTDPTLYDAVTKAADGVNDAINKINRFRTFVEFRGEHLERTDAKGYFTVTFQPKEDKYYLIGIVSDPEGRVDTKTTIITDDQGTTTVTKDTIENEIEFTVQFARRFADLALRIGVTESTFGAGADYFLLDDSLRLTADIWDFGNDEPYADKAHLKVGIDYAPIRNVFVWGGYDNILNEERRGYFIGGGIRFEDEDLKYLFGTASSLLP